MPRPDDPAPPPAVAEALAKAAKGATPKGWAVAPKGAALVVRRDKPVASHFATNAPPGSIRSSAPAYEIVLTFRTRVSPEQYARLRQESAALGKKLEAMCEGLRAAGVAHKFDEWLPDTDAQKKQVAAYRAEQ